MLDGRIGNFINTYNVKRDELNRNNYLSKNNNWYRDFHLPFAEWTSPSMLEEENIFFANMVDKVKNSCIPEKSLSITVLSLKNRIEYISEHIDFLTLYTACFIILISFLKVLFNFFKKIDTNNEYELIFNSFDVFITFLGIICIVFFSIEKYCVRREVMYKKEIINIFEKCISENKK